MKQSMGLFLTLYCLMSLAPGALSETVTPLDSSAFDHRYYQNPSGIKDIGDPFILYAQGVYWCFATTGGLFYQVRQSTDLVTWGKPTYAFAPDKDSWADRDFWAPEVYAYHGVYYLFYSAREKASGSLRIGVARADKPQGPYKDLRNEPLFDYGYAAIDAHLFIDEGQPYLFFARDCSENIVQGRHESHLYGVRLSSALDAVVGDPVLLTRPDQPWEMASGPTWLWNEGASLIKHGGRYYLYYSANYYAGKEYAVGVAVADAPLGPYTKPGDAPLMQYVEEEREVVVSGPGHNSFFLVGDELFTVYHTHVHPRSPSGYRQMAFDRAGFRGDGSPYINGPTLGAQLRPLALLGLRNHLPDAVPAAPEAALLSDGDYGIGGSGLAPDVLSQSVLEWTWDSPVQVDSLILYAQNGEDAAGRFVFDGDDTLPFTMTAGNIALGDSLRLHFAQRRVSRLQIIWDGQAPLARELLVIGQAP